MNYIVITGASKGIGFAFAKQLLKTRSPVHLIAISRSEGGLSELQKTANDCNGKVEFVAADLTDLDNLNELFRNGVWSKIDQSKAASVALIINAGDAFTATVGTQPIDRIARVIALNTTAPLIVLDSFVSSFQATDCDKRVMCIGSGAGRRPIEGWATYGASKAALDMMARVAHLEQATHSKPIKIVSYGPGVVETAMQATIRSADADLPIKRRLIEMYNNGTSFTTEKAAEIGCQYLLSDAFGTTALQDVYDLDK